MSDAAAETAGDAASRAGSFADRVDEYRTIRARLEREILPLATSVDGRQFTFQASLHGLALQTGGYVILEGDGRRFLGQVLAMRADSMSVPDFGLGAAASNVQIR